MKAELAARGKVVFEGEIASAVLGASRMVRIYLPPSYEREPARRYPVLYLHDGQNVFTTAGPDIAFGWGNWALDQTADEWAAAGKMSEIIMVAVDNTSARYLEYRGPSASSGVETKSVNRRKARAGNDTLFEKYARFLIEELKPGIDRDYRTLAGAKHTGVMGASMGGICSLVLGWEHPKVFGVVASVSGAFQVEHEHFLRNVLGAYQGRPKPVRIYLDSGTADDGGGDDGLKETTAVAQALRRIGWRDGKKLEQFIDARPMTEPELERAGLRRDKWREALINQHNEFYWRLRAWRALVFMFPNGA